MQCCLGDFDLHSLATVAFANDEVASGGVAPVHGVEPSVSALPGEFGILVCPVLRCKSLLPPHEFRGLTLDELGLAFDGTESGSRNDTSNERGDGQKEFVECNHGGYAVKLRL